MAEVGGHRLVDRILDPDEVAAVLTWLCSPKSAAITGSGVHADGGFLGCVRRARCLLARWVFRRAAGRARVGAPRGRPPHRRMPDASHGQEPPVPVASKQTSGMASVPLPELQRTGFPAGDRRRDPLPQCSGTHERIARMLRPRSRSGRPRPSAVRSL
ncbi:SDR family oxidoreductase [Nocardia vermiculata]|uniref:SDR family oxidoreductase n=1 Tax=Nocardia vermiculata TaxID=257274 RepID=UPI002480F1F7|nr:SDR family oxidoreductase [Nocardia vermiculata]